MLFILATKKQHIFLISKFSKNYYLSFCCY